MENKKCLISGAKGFCGSHLVDFLIAKGYEVWGIDRWMAKDDNISHLLSNDGFHLIDGDMSDYTSVKEALELSQPDEIYHLAAQSYVPASWNHPAETLTNNIVGEVNIFEACRSLGLKPKIQIAGSSEEYGLVIDDAPLTEKSELRPLSPYGVSKVAQDYLARQYYWSYGLPTVVTRAFNHEGPRRGEVFVTSNFAKQIAMIEAFKQDPIISVGNLEAKRDFTDVRDMVKAYWLALQKGEPGEVYNICSEKAYSIREMLNILLKLTKVKVEIMQDPLRMRPSDVPILLGDCRKFRETTGWSATIPFEKTLADLLEYWREKCKK